MNINEFSKLQTQVLKRLFEIFQNIAVPRQADLKKKFNARYEEF